MSEQFSEAKQAAIRSYHNQQRGVVKGNNLQGEPLSSFDIFAETPRPGARNVIERWMVDLPQVTQMEMSSQSGISVVIVE